MKIHEIIRTRRQALGLTQEVLAEKVRVSAMAVNKWEKSTELSRYHAAAHACPHAGR